MSERLLYCSFVSFLLSLRALESNHGYLRELSTYEANFLSAPFCDWASKKMQFVTVEYSILRVERSRLLRTPYSILRLYGIFLSLRFTVFTVLFVKIYLLFY